MSYTDVVQAIADATQDAQTLEDVINGEPNKQAQSRLGRLIYTLATINHRVDIATNQANQKLTDLDNAINTAAAAGAGANGWTDLLITTESGKTQREINNRQLRKEYHVLDLGMKMDGSDETAKLNEIIARLDNCKLVIGGGNLRVSKTTKYASDYPRNDQPCIAILDKTNLTIEIASGTTISVKEHGQSIFEMMRCKNTTIINNGILKGAGNFPLLDGTTGYAEKGTTTVGYDTKPGFYKNNSLDTSANTTGGYSHNFPQWGGGTSSTWGKWNGGFIGNEGYGVLIHNDCNRCGVTGIGEVFGFNGSGIQIGFNGAYRSPSLNYPVSKLCFVIGQTVHDCYQGGITHSNCIDTRIFQNHVYEIGHPNSVATDAMYDPGYGIYTGYSIGANAENALITNNHVHHCKRKGIDLHSGINYTIADNKVTDCRIVGIFASQSDVANVYTVNNKVTNNTLIRCGTATRENIYQNIGGIQIYSLIGGKNNIEVINNTLIDCVGCRGVINIDAGTHNIVRGNTIRGNNYPTNPYRFAGIDIGAYDGEQTVANTVIEDNYIVTNEYMVKGVVTHNGSGLIKDNILVLESGSIVGFDNLGTGTAYDYIGNHVVANYGRAYNIDSTTGVKLRNTATVATGAALGLNKTTNLGEPRVASLNIAFNNTDTPTLTVTKGSDYIASVAASTYGIEILLKNIGTFSTVYALSERTSSEGLVSTSGNVNYIYIREITNAHILIGLQTAPATPHIQTKDVIRGNFRVDVLIV